MINGRVFLILLAISNCIYFTMVLWSIPTLAEFSQGLPVFDLRFYGYNYQEAMELLNALSAQGIQFYKNIQLRLDLFYPATFMLSYSVGCLWGYGHLNSKWKTLGKFGAIICIIAGLSDYIENYHIYKMLTTYPALMPKLVEQANIATIAKSIFTSIGLSILMVGLIGKFRRYLRIKREPVL